MAKNCFCFGSYNVLSIVVIWLVVGETSGAVVGSHQDDARGSSSAESSLSGGGTRTLNSPSPGVDKFQIEGKVSVPKTDSRVPLNWQSYTRILLNYGKHVGFVQEDGSFVVSNIPSGSYIVEVGNKDFIFEPFRVDITTKGKIRARKLQLLQPSAVTQVPYPLKFLARQPAKYFRDREQWRITDLLLSPMVLMMVLPVLLFMVLPKLINTDDPEIQREMQQSLQMPKYDMPEVSEMMAKWFGGGAKKPKPKAITAKTKRN